MTAFARHISDPDRSLVRPLAVRSLPAGVRVAIGLMIATALLWPLAPLVADVITRDASTTGLASATWLSLWQAASAATAGIALSVPIGWALARLAVPARRLVRALLTVPVIAPPLGIALGTSLLLGDRWPLLVVANVGFGLAVGVRLGGFAWLALDPRESETARTLGLGPWQIVRWHYLPALGRMYTGAWALAFALAFSTFGTVHLLASASTPALPELAGAAVPAPSASSAALVLAAVAAVALVVFVHCRPGSAIVTGDVGYRPLTEVRVRDRLLLAAAFVLATLIALGPVGALFHAALTVGAAEQVTGGNIAAIFEDARPFEVDAWNALRRSLTLGTAALLIALPLGAAVAFVIAPLRGWAATLTEAALLLPLLLPVVLASGLREAGFDRSFWLLLVHVAIAVPIVIRIVLPGARSRLRSQFEAATILGASRWASWNRLAARSLRAQLWVAAALTLAWSVGEVGAARLLHRVDTAPASVAITRSLAQQTDAGDGRAIALAGLLALFVTILFVTIEYRRSREITEF